jgi:hypothetical protein
LCTSVRILRVGEGHLFAELIANSERTCPVVLLSQIYCDQGSAIDSAKLARLLAGTAIVFQSESSEVDTELEYVLGKRFSCWNGMVRIYVPGLSFDRQGDEKRHRFILKREIDSSGPDAIIESIVRCIARRSTRPKGVLIPLDVEAISRQRRLVQLRTQRRSTSDDELIQLLEENETLRIEKAKIEDDNLLLEDRIDSLEDDVRRLEYDKDALKANLAQTNVVADQSKLLPILEGVKELPRTLSEVVERIKTIHSERIAFTERAIKSARDTKCDDVPTAWRAIWAMATILYDVFWKQEGGDKQKMFQDQSGFELAMTEGKLTNQDAKLMSLRKDIFKGREIDITPHVKFDRASARAYFCPFQENGTKLIVVGHIGGHLNTAGTRKQRR